MDKIVMIKGKDKKFVEKESTKELLEKAGWRDENEPEEVETLKPTIPATPSAPNSGKTLNADANAKEEDTALRARAVELGLKPHPKLGLVKLRKLVADNELNTSSNEEDTE